MATGIISVDAFAAGPAWLSRALLTVALAGLAVLGTAWLLRVMKFTARVAADVWSPERAFGFFTIPAGLDVIGVRLTQSGHPVATAILAGLAAVAWLLLCYGVPASLLLARDRSGVLRAADGTWLMWAVGTQSLSAAASSLVPAWRSQAALLASAAVGLWSVGVVLYLLLVCTILLRWLAFPVTPATVGPSYWILMGAAAISVLAGAGITSLPAAIPVIRATAVFVTGSCFALWSFATWWIPLLLGLGVWRHLRRRWPLRYEPALWSMVFPLGMYSAASLSFGSAAHLGFISSVGRVDLWVAVAAWLAVAAGFVNRRVR
jgi:tellurite resistance protein TehA-like permease